MKSGKRAFITGGGGFLGRTVTPLFRNAGWEVDAPCSKECDLRLAESLFARREPYDLILHLAAWTQAGDFCLHHPGEQWIINQQINTNLLAWWKDCQPQAKAVFIGTSCAYDPSLPLVEENYLLGEPIASLYVYAMTKRMLEIGARALAKQFGLSHMTLVPGTLCGTYYHEDGRQMHFIYDLARKIIHAKKTGEPAVLWGDGNQKREITAVSDFANVALALVESGNAWGELINLGAGRDHSIREFANEICRATDTSENLVSYDTSRYTGAKSKCLQVEKIRSYLEWEPMPMEGCVQQVLKAFK
jgi:GDP-L-fucose synthase